MKSWYLLYCKRGERSRAFLNLKQQGIECYCPEITSNDSSGKKKGVTKDLSLQNYIFAQFDHTRGPSFTSIRSTRGVVDFIRCGSQPKKIANDMIDSLKKQYNSLSLG